MLGQTRLSDRFPRPTLAAAAAAIHDVVSTAELLAAGITEVQIRHLVAIGFLYRIHRGVYAVGRRALSPEGRRRAAWLACGDGSAISHGTALADWKIARWPGPVHVSTRSGGAHRGVVVHRPRSLHPDDIVERTGYAVTSVARAILDTAPRRSLDVVAGWIHEAGVQDVFDPAAMLATLDRNPQHRGVRLVGAAMTHEFVVTRSGLEDAWLAISRRARMPRVIGNDIVLTERGEEEVDFHYPSLNLVVEVDSVRYHSSRWRRRRDAEKTARLKRAGKRVRRVGELEITLDADGLVAKLVALRAGDGRRNRADGPVSPTTA